MRKWFLFLFLSFFLLSCKPSPSVEMPDVFVFGESQQVVLDKIHPLCNLVDVHRIDPVEIPTAKESQIQIDCDEFIYAGKPRTIELIFADDMLDMIWIITEPEEEIFFINQFSKLYGEPTHPREEVTFFLHHGVAVGNQPHEVLFISERLETAFSEWLEKNQ